MVIIRTAKHSDCFNIATLHAKSWQLHYRGNFPDAYLDGPVLEDRKAVWKARFDDPQDHMRILIAERDGVLLGFVCYFLKDDEQWGTLIDNLHVSKESQGLGIGRSLLREASANIKEESKAAHFYLYVLTDNEQAISFYQKSGGEIVDREILENPGGSGRSEVFKVAWIRGIKKPAE